MRQQLLTEPDDVQWALEKVFVEIRPEFFPGSCLLTGNDDAPEKLEFYVSVNPLISDVPFITICFQES